MRQKTREGQFMKKTQEGREFPYNASGRGMLFGVSGIVLALLLAVVSPLVASADSLDDFIRVNMAVANVPGFSACIVKNGQVVWSKGYGWANIEQRTPVTPETLFMIASISKTVTGTALMQLWEQGAFTLDDPINNYLPFPVSNPKYPKTPITFRQLLSHVSSISDDNDLMFKFYTEGDSPIPLSLALRSYLSPGGVQYQPDSNFYDYAPGTGWAYSNTGFALNGYLVESITGIPFSEYSEQHIFGPLQMNETSWFLRDLDQSHIAMPYHFNVKDRRYIAYGQYGYPGYPYGQLRTSVLQLARFLLATINYGELDGARILDEATAEEMRRVQYPELNPAQGLAWVYENYNDETFLGHNGNDPGVFTLMWFRPADGVGVIALANGDTSYPLQTKALIDIVGRLFQEAEQY